MARREPAGQVHSSLLVPLSSPTLTPSSSSSPPHLGHLLPSLSGRDYHQIGISSEHLSSPFQLNLPTAAVQPPTLSTAPFSPPSLSGVGYIPVSPQLQSSPSFPASPLNFNRNTEKAPFLNLSPSCNYSQTQSCQNSSLGPLNASSISPQLHTSSLYRTDASSSLLNDPRCSNHPKSAESHSALSSLSKSKQNKLVKQSGRAKVNTLPPWAKSLEDDDQLFDSPPSSSTSTLTPTGSLLRRSESTSSQSRTPIRLSQSKLPRSSFSNITLVPDSPLHNREVNADAVLRHDNQFCKESEPGGATHRSSYDDSARVHTRKKVSRLSRHRSQDDVLTSGTVPDNDANRTMPVRRSIYRAVTAPSPVFQRFRPHIPIGTNKRKLVQDDEKVDDDRKVGAQGPVDSFAGDSSRHPRHNPDDRWWQFTLPTKYRRKVEEYINRAGPGHGFTMYFSEHPTGAPKDKTEVDSEKPAIFDPFGASGGFHTGSPNSHHERPESASPKFPPDDIGWFHAWKRSHDDLLTNSQNSRPPSDFPLAAFSRKMSLTHIQAQQVSNDSDSLGLRSQGPPALREVINIQGAKPMAYGYSSDDVAIKRLAYYLLHHPMAPFLCRLFNFAFTTTSLALSVRIRGIQKDLGANDILGNSAIFILVVSPFSILHNLFAIYCEYFGAPIGIWSVSWKMFHTLSELVFISIWSAGLALAFDDELMSVLKCTSSPDSDPIVLSGSGRQGGGGRLLQIARDRRDELCGLQGGLVGMIFFGLLVYTSVLILSLFRIFDKVSRKY